MEESEQRRGRILALVLIALPIVVTVLIYAGVKTYDHIDDAYAQWGAADMVIEYMADHNGDWPKNWTSLQTYFEKNNGRVGGWSFAEFQAHVYIDFDVDSNLLRQLSCESDSVPFNVIYAISFWASQFGGGPNEILYRYFRDGCEGR